MASVAAPRTMTAHGDVALISGFEDVAGRLDPEEFARYAVADDATAYGDLKSLGPVIRMSGTPPHWSRTTPRLGSSRPEWIPR
ncbi:hypothetical protein [Streptomyces rimosus]|uniref:hypothetical protein n=1 Tax=Streptomyces rimosus TaxID=1927 RepID=UPI0037AC3632